MQCCYKVEHGVADLIDDGMRILIACTCIHGCIITLIFFTAVTSVFKLTVLVDGVSTIKCAVEHQLLVSMEQMTISYKFVAYFSLYHYFKNAFSVRYYSVANDESRLHCCMSTVGSSPWRWRELSSTSSSQQKH